MTETLYGFPLEQKKFVLELAAGTSVYCPGNNLGANWFLRVVALATIKSDLKGSIGVFSSDLAGNELVLLAYIDFDARQPLIVKKNSKGELSANVELWDFASLEREQNAWVIDLTRELLKTPIG